MSTPNSSRYPAAASVAVCAMLTNANSARADINPWIAAELYDPAKWDTAGPQTATPWLHPFTWTPGQEWGVLFGNIGAATAFTGSWGGKRDELVKQGVSFAAAYKAQPMWNVSGGKETGLSNLGNLYAGAYLDLQRLMGWDGGFFKISMDGKTGDKGLTPRLHRQRVPGADIHRPERHPAAASGLRPAAF
jgi:hypothetical protein